MLQLFHQLSGFIKQNPPDKKNFGVYQAMVLVNNSWAMQTLTIQYEVKVLLYSGENQSCCGEIFIYSAC
jgi:hypothetical protein